MAQTSYTAIPDGIFEDEEVALLSSNANQKTETEKAKELSGSNGPAPVAMTTERLIMSINYMLSMGICGIVLVALGSTLTGLAARIGIKATQLGTVFIARGIGAVLGAISSAKLYMWFQGNHVLAVSLFFVFVLLCVMPYNESLVGLHFLFLLLGWNTAVTDTGCQIMTRKLHGKTAGPWLGANTVAFGISGAIVPVIEIYTESIFWQYYLMAGFVFLVTLSVIFGPNPEKNGRLAGPPKKDAPKTLHYHSEFIIALMVFCFIGGKVTSTAYLDTYVAETGVIPSTSDAKLMFVLWIAITIGRLAGVQDQRFLTNKTLPIHLTVLCVGGFLSMLLILWFPTTPDALWVGVAFYGLFNGPCVGYCYDWNNRTTFPTETSMSIVMFGLNFGASLVPYITTYIWENGGGPDTLIVVVFLSMLIPLPLLHITKYVSYEPSINPWLRHAYQTLDQDETQHHA